MTLLINSWFLLFSKGNKSLQAVRHISRKWEREGVPVSHDDFVKVARKALSAPSERTENCMVKEKSKIKSHWYSFFFINFKHIGAFIEHLLHFEEPSASTSIVSYHVFPHFLLFPAPPTGYFPPGAVDAEAAGAVRAVMVESSAGVIVQVTAGLSPRRGTPAEMKRGRSAAAWEVGEPGDWGEIFGREGPSGGEGKQ